MSIVRSLAWATILLSTVSAMGQETFDLKPRAKVGDRFKFDASQEIHQQLTITGAGQDADAKAQTQRVDQTMLTTRKGTVEVLAVRDGLPSSVRLQFDPTSGGTLQNAPGEPGPRVEAAQGAGAGKQEMKFALAGQTVTLTRDEKGQLQDDAQVELDPPAKAELNVYLPAASAMPAQPVAVGAEWDPDTSTMARSMQLGEKDTLKMHCKLSGLRDLNGRKVGEVQSTMELTRADPSGMIVSSKTEGTMLVDLASGTIVQTDSQGKLSVNGTQEQPSGGTVQINGDGTIKSHATMLPAGAGEGGGIAGGAGAGGAGLAGTFQDAQLTIKLGPGPGGTVSGTIYLKDQRFPLTGKVLADHITGQFESQGDKFDFEAMLAGDVLTFITGQTTYRLKRVETTAPATQP